MASSRPLRAAVYARVSTYDQEVENQLGELRRFVDARGWEAREYVDEGISGAVEQRPALDELVRDAKRRRFDVLVCWRLDRLGRSLKHLITLLDDLQALGVAFVSLAEGIDATTPAGKLQMHILGAISEFERARTSPNASKPAWRGPGSKASAWDARRPGSARRTSSAPQISPCVTRRGRSAWRPPSCTAPARLPG